MKSPRLRFLTSSDMRQINGATRRLCRIGSQAELAAVFVEEVGRCVPGDLNAWNETTADFSGFKGFDASRDYLVEVRKRLDAIVAYLPRHPVIASVGWEGWHGGPRLLTEFTSSRAFNEHPLYREAYRHLDSKYQVGFQIGIVGNTAVTVTLNRKDRDYSDRDCQKLHLLGSRVFRIWRLLNEQQVLRTQLEAIEEGFAFGPASLTLAELRLLQKTLHGANRPRLPSRLSQAECNTRQAVIKKLELESSSQLFALLNRFRS